MQTPVNEFEPMDVGRLRRRQSWVSLHRRRSQRLEELQDLYNNNRKTPNSLKDPFNFIHVLTLLLCATRTLKCKLCEQLFLDVTVMNCGHSFCRFCLTAWLQTKENCPICLNFEVHPVCNRCYNLDCLTESFYRQLLEILDPVSISPLITSSASASTSDQVTLNYQLHLKTKPQLYMIKRLESIRKMHKIREDRRAAMNNSGGGCIIKLWSCPNRSMLQGVCDLGFGLRNCMAGFILLVIGSFFLALSVCHFSDLLEMLQLFAMRRICYVAVILYLVCTKRNPIVRFGEVEGRNLFWKQILKTTVTEEYDPRFQNEKVTMERLIKKQAMDFQAVHKEVTEIVETLRQYFPRRS